MTSGDDRAAPGAAPGAPGTGADLLALPELRPPDPGSLVLAEPAPPSDGRPCGNCRAAVGRPFGDLPAVPKGYCAVCRTPYSLLPQLDSGELLDGGRYEVRGCLAHGGLGWIYLADDTRLPGRAVALKGVLNPHQPDAAARMQDERDRMIAISHESIVRILDYVAHEPDDGRLPADYIVMEFVGGKSLRAIVTEAAHGRRPLGADEPLTLEHAARYGCQILTALSALHERGLVYSDMKPDNVIHRGTRVVLIDLGGVQRPGDTDGPCVTTPRYRAPETGPGKGPPTVAHDLHTVGVTLADLRAAVEHQPPGHGLGVQSFDRLLARATATDPRERFASAAEMGEQLEGVLRELLSLRTGRQHTRPSTVFAPTYTLLDSGLGAVPGPEHWDGREARSYRAARITAPTLCDGRPTAAAVAAGLPEPFPHPADPAIAQLRLPPPQDPLGVVRQLGRYLDAQEDGMRPSVEVRLRLCRAHLRAMEELPPRDAEGRAGELAAAGHWLAEAERVRGTAPPAPGASWRFDWHRGLVELARGGTAAALARFDAVHRALPGEYAPKLAVAQCAERAGRPEEAERFYHAVWRRNNQQAGAAFGLARVHLARGGREEAAEVLDAVPPVSRHYDAARVAAVRIRAARLATPDGDPDTGLPALSSLARAARDLPGLDLDGGAEHGAERDRLTAELREWALDRVQRTCRDAAERAGLAELAGPLFGEGPTEHGLRGLLAESFLALAELCRAAEARHEHLVDCANAVHPRTWLFGGPGGGRRGAERRGRARPEREHGPGPAPGGERRADGRRRRR
ncbi:serine/threonine-protein kinase [Streptomyces capparidis]